MTLTYKTFTVETKAIDEDQGIYEAMVSTESVDRDGDVLLADGAVLDNYVKNPVVLFGHDYRNPNAVVARALEVEKIAGKGIRLVFKFLGRGISTSADLVHDLWKEKFLNAMSVGFIPREMERRTDENGEQLARGLLFKVWEMLEGSIVTIPANQDALRLAYADLEAKGYSRDDIDELFQAKRGRVLSAANEKRIRQAVAALQEVLESLGDESEEEGLEDYLEKDIVTKFAGSPMNPFGTHSSYQFKGGMDGYKRAWRLHFSQIGGGATTGTASGPIRGTVRRCEMIAATLQSPCSLPSTDGIGPRAGPKSPLEGTFPEKPSDYGLDAWKDPETDADREGIKLSCSDLKIIKTSALAEIKRRAEDREREGAASLSEDDFQATEEKPFKNEHACRLLDPEKFDQDSFRRTTRKHDGKEYAVIMGKLNGEDKKMTDQAFRYPKDTWNVEEARKHCNDHDGIEFAPAIGEEENENYTLSDDYCAHRKAGALITAMDESDAEPNIDDTPDTGTPDDTGTHDASEAELEALAGPLSNLLETLKSGLFQRA